MPRTLRVMFVVAVCAGLAVAACAAPAEGSKKTSSGQAAGSGVAATVGDKTIPMSEVDARAKTANSEVYQQLYTARRQALDSLVAEALVEKEAATRGVSPEELVKQEIESKLTDVSESDIEMFYNQNQAQMGNQTLEQMSGRIKNFLTQQQAGSRRDEFLDGLKKKYGVKIALDPPRVDVQVAADEPAKGPADAPILIVEYSEFQCPYCQRVGPTVKQVLDTYGDKVRLVFRDYPLPFHNNAAMASQAGQCAHDQGKFWEYHDKLFANQKALEVDSLKKYAAELGLDADKFNACLDSGSQKAKVDADVERGTASGVRGTPAFFINGRFLSGAQPFAAFQAIIDEELDLAGQG